MIGKNNMKKDIFEIYKNKQINKIRKIYNKMDSISSLTIYKKLLRKIKKNVFPNVRVHNVQHLKELYAKIDDIKFEINKYHIKNLKDKNSNYENKKKIKFLQNKINSINKIINLYSRELFYFELKKQMIDYFKKVTNGSPGMFEDYIKMWIHKKIRYSHNAFYIMYDNQKITFNDDYVSNEEFLNRFSLLELENSKNLLNKKINKIVISK